MVSSIGIIGTAKNTGKTTTLAAILSEGIKNNNHFALTSIGYDGEAVDNLTLLPKPRLFVNENQILATAEKCVQWAEADVEILEKTKINSGLGEIFIVKVKKSGKIIIAGANKHKSLTKIIEILSKWTDNVIIDGALGRIAPFSTVDAIIFSTGAARNTIIDILVQEMKAINEIFSLPQCEIKIADKDKEFGLENLNEIALINGDKNEFLNFSSVLSLKDADEFSQKVYKFQPQKIYIPGAISSKHFNHFLQKSVCHLKGTEIIFFSAPTLLSGWDPIPLRNILHSSFNTGIKFGILKKQPILAITVNPFYPKRIHRGARFTPGYVDADELKNIFEKEFKIPVIDIFKDGTERIFTILSDYNQK